MPTGELEFLEKFNGGVIKPVGGREIKGFLGAVSASMCRILSR